MRAVGFVLSCGTVTCCYGACGQGWIQTSSSDLHKSLKCFQVFAFFYFSGSLFSSRNKLIYLSCFIVYYKIKQRKKRRLVIPSNSQQIQPFPGEFDESPFARFRPLSILPDQREKIRRHDWKKFVRSGWDWVVYGSFHESLKILSDWPETLALSCESLKLGFDWLSRPQTTVQTSDNRI